MIEESEGRLSRFKETLGDVGKVAAGMIAGNVLQGLTHDLSEQFSDIIGQTTAWGEEVRVLSQNMGVSTEDASTLALAMKDLNIQPEVGEKAFAKFAKGLNGVEDEMEGALKGTKSTLDSLKDLGVKTDDAGGHMRPFMNILGDVADKFHDMPDGMAKTQLAMSMFGRAGADMIPLLNLGKEGLAEISAEAKKYGLQLSAENVQQIRQFALAHNEMDAAVEGARLQIGVMFIPMLTKAVGAVTEAVVATREFVGELAPLKDMLVALAHGDANSFFVALSSGLEELTGGAINEDKLRELTNGIFGVVGAIKQMASGDLGGGLGQLMAHLGDLGTMMGDKLKGLAGELGAAVQSWIPPLTDWVVTAVPPLLANLAGLLVRFLVWTVQVRLQLVQRLAEWGLEFIQWIAPMVPGMLNELGQAAMRLYGWIGEQVGPLLDQLGGWAQQFWGWVQEAVPPLLDQAANLKDQLLQWIADEVPLLVDQLKLWGSEFWAWVKPQIDPLLENLGVLLGELLGWVVTALVGLTAKLIEWGSAFVEWVAPRIPQLLVELAKLDLAIVQWILNDAIPAVASGMVSLGKGLITGLLQGMAPLGQALQQALVDALNSIHINAGPFHLSTSGFKMDPPVGLPGPVASFFGGARAGGGPVNAGELYLVGENGPELFAPGANGAVLPNSFMGGGGGGMDYGRMVQALREVLGTGDVTLVMDSQVVARVTRQQLLRLGNGLTSIGLA